MVIKYAGSSELPSIIFALSSRMIMMELSGRWNVWARLKEKSDMNANAPFTYNETVSILNRNSRIRECSITWMLVLIVTTTMES